MGLSIYTSPNPQAEYTEDGEGGPELVDEILQRSCSGFGRWRVSLAEAAGIGSRGEDYGPGPDIDYRPYAHKNYQGEWDEGTEPEDPLYLLFIHSDWDGMLPHKYMAPLADRLEEILPNMRPDEVFYASSDLGTTEKFIAGLRTAHEEGYGLIFR